mgnify:CR=1 FL=1
MPVRTCAWLLDLGRTFRTAGSLFFDVPHRTWSPSAWDSRGRNTAALVSSASTHPPLFRAIFLKYFLISLDLH